MKNITTSIYTFEKLIKGNYLYIDKTEYIWNLIKDPYGIYFMSRPRRFGKSLTLSTLKAVFQNKKHLFNGLALENKPYDWKEYPIIHLDLGESGKRTADMLEAYLEERVLDIASKFNLKLTNRGASGKFRELIDKVAGEGKLIILVDEYDKPILSNLNNPEAKEILRTLKDFYSVIKTSEAHQRFVLLTGVSKFSRVSVFSDLNNLTDITMSAPYAGMLGYNQAELETYFAEYINEIVNKQKISRNSLLDKMREWYNGYRFEEKSETVYNPVSIGKFFESKGKFSNYWFETGTPTFLIELLKQKNYNLQDVSAKKVSELAFSSYEVDRLEPIPLLFQTGYLTIKDFMQKDDFRLFTLDYPNLEVESAFNAYLIDAYANIPKENVDGYLLEMIEALEKADLDLFFQTLSYFFANIDYDLHLKHEKYYQTIFYVLFKLLGLHIRAEEKTSIGRIDAVIKTDSHIYIFEFKLDGSTKKGLSQIREKEYFLKYQNSERIIVLISANFSYKKRGVESWKSETIEP